MRCHKEYKKLRKHDHGNASNMVLINNVGIGGNEVEWLFPL